MIFLRSCYKIDPNITTKAIMKKLTILLLFTSFFSYAQIDYKALVKNLEDITIETNLENYFKGLPVQSEYGSIEFNDERFLRFYGVIVNKVAVNNNWRGISLEITPFNKVRDFEEMKNKLSNFYGEPETNESNNWIKYFWENDTKHITLSINLGDENEGEKLKGKFKNFDDLTIFLKEKK